MSKLFSVVICSYNRSKMLTGCIESLLNQTLNKDQYEIIVVDNNSSDDTNEVVRNFSAYENFIYVIEKTPGLSHARNRGLRESSGNYVAFIDDDARAASNWLILAKNIVEKIDLDCLGGPIHPFYLYDKPDWFLDKYEIRSLGDTPKFLQKGEYISGSNMIWKKSSLMAVNGFDVDAGIVGNQLRLGEESGAIDKLWNSVKVPKIYYSPDLIVYHWVPEFKMSISYRLKRRFAEGQYQASSIGPISFMRRIKIALVTGAILIKVTIRFLIKIGNHSHWQNWIVEDGRYVVRVLGKLLGTIGVYPKFDHRTN